ncbi:MAG TPA: urease accessory protein [Thermoanaerobaculia bacterium]|nr:urease accessory protein [Thermoanaerobaculia bacterium]
MPDPLASAPNATLLATLGLGFLLGLKHALDADHLVAVSTIVSREGSARSTWRVGAWWGIGHSAAVLAASLGVIALRRAIPPRAAEVLEAGVGVMLVVLGADLLRRLVKGELRVHAHAHDGHTHLHAHVGDAAPAGHHHPGRRPFVVGVVHGLAGSAALTLFVVSTIRSPLMALSYVALFGIGTVVGMMVMTALVGLPIALATRTASGLSSRIQLLASIGSIGFGFWYAFRVVLESGWLRG